MSVPYAALDERDLAHALMAILRWRSDLGWTRLLRGESPQTLGRHGPRASGALLHAKTGHVVVAAEAVAPDASHASVERALERALPLAEWVAERAADASDPAQLPSVWVCAPKEAAVHLARERPVPGIKWVGYEVPTVAEMAPAVAPAPTDRLAKHKQEMERLLARRDEAMRAHAEAYVRNVGIRDAVMKGHRFVYSGQSHAETERAASGISRRYLAMRVAIAATKTGRDPDDE